MRRYSSLLDQANTAAWSGLVTRHGSAIRRLDVAAALAQALPPGLAAPYRGWVSARSKDRDGNAVQLRVGAADLVLRVSRSRAPLTHGQWADLKSAGDRLLGVPANVTLAREPPRSPGPVPPSGEGGRTAARGRGARPGGGRWLSFAQSAAAGRNLRALRNGKGWTLAGIAGIADMDTTALSRLENGERRLRRAHAEYLAEPYGVTVPQLLAPDPEPSPGGPEL